MEAWGVNGRCSCSVMVDGGEQGGGDGIERRPNGEGTKRLITEGVEG